MNIVIVDFEDSFTYNIASELQALNIDSEVVHFSQISQYYELMKSGPHNQCLVLGPGPGHPDEYEAIIPVITDFLDLKHIYVMGICLGHQLIWKSLGAKIHQMENPIHGVQLSLKLSEKMRKKLHLGQTEVKVQVYNSLEVRPLKEHEEKFDLSYQGNSLVASFSERMISYQFHPESIGTSYRSCYFSPLQQFLL